MCTETILCHMMKSRVRIGICYFLLDENRGNSHQIPKSYKACLSKIKSISSSKILSIRVKNSKPSLLAPHAHLSKNWINNVLHDLIRNLTSDYKDEVSTSEINKLVTLFINSSTYSNVLHIDTRTRMLVPCKKTFLPGPSLRNKILISHIALKNWSKTTYRKLLSNGKTCHYVNE